jgi:hypothetical protein
LSISFGFVFLLKSGRKQPIKIEHMNAIQIDTETAQVAILHAWEAIKTAPHGAERAKAVKHWAKLNDAFEVAGFRDMLTDCGENIDAHVPAWENPRKESELQYNRPLSEDNRTDRVLMDCARISVEEMAPESFIVIPV